MKIPGVYVEIKGDTAQLKQDITQAKQLITEQAKGMSDALNNALSSGQIKSSVTSLTTNLGTLARSSQLNKEAFNNLGVELGELRSITKMTDADFKKLQSQMLNTQASKAQENSLRSIARSANLTEKEVRALGKQFGLTNTQIDNVNGRLNKNQKALSSTHSAVGLLSRSLVPLIAGFASLQSIRALTSIADKYTLIDAKIKLGTGSQEEFNTVYDSLYTMSRNTGSQMETNAQSFNKLALSMDIDTTSLIRSQDILNKAMVVSGATVEENTSFMLQYAQAMGSGVLQGDELKSMSEANSFIMKKVAAELDTNIAGLKKMGKEGTLTSEKFFNALIKVGEEVDAQFSQMPITVSRAGNDLSQVLQGLVADANESSGATAGLAAEISGIAQTIDDNKDAILALFTSIVKVAGQSVDAVGDLTRSIQGLAIVAASEDKSLLDWIMASPEDMKKWQQGITDGTMFLEDQLAATRDKILDVQSSWGMWGDKQADLEKLRTEEAQIISSINRIKSAASADIVVADTKTTVATAKKKIIAPVSSAADLKKEEAARKAQLKEYKRNLKEQADLRADLTQKVKELTLSENDYKHWMLDVELADMRTHAQGQKDILDQIETYAKAKNVQLKIEFNEDIDDALKDFFDDIDKLGDKSVETADDMKDAFSGWASSMSSDMNDVLWGAELTFDSMAESFGKMITQMIIQKSVLEPIMGGLFGDGTSGSTGLLSGLGDLFGFHSGGIVGADSPTFTRSMPRFHSGGIIGSDEVPAILQKGEGVFTAGQMAALGSGSGGNTNINIINNTSGSVTTSEKPNSSGGMDLEIIIDQLVAKKMNSAGSATQKAMYSTTGASRQLTRR